MKRRDAPSSEYVFTRCDSTSRRPALVQPLSLVSLTVRVRAVFAIKYPVCDAVLCGACAGISEYTLAVSGAE